MNKVWKEEEKDFLREHANKLKDVDIAAKLTEMSGRKVTLNAVRKMRQKLGLKKKCGRGKCELDEVHKMRELFEIAEDLGMVEIDT